jgi:hypothetical protein
MLKLPSRRLARNRPACTRNNEQKFLVLFFKKEQKESASF